MHLNYRNVNDAFTGLVGMFHTKEFGPGSDWRRHGDAFPAVRRSSRNGAALVIDEPVTITYTHPTERVLLNPARDANPFFHLYESLWMLAGRNDVAPLAFYNSRIAGFSDDGKTFNGAYGYRWRNSMTDRTDNDPVGTEYISKNHEQSIHGYRLRRRTDQLDVIVNHLKADPTSRRAVLQMWNVEDDLLKIGKNCSNCGYPRHNERHDDCCPDGTTHDHVRPSKDVCCNLSVMFSVRDSTEPSSAGGHLQHLDMTVTNRSNDLVWGLLGANYVHFTFLQEYLAARLGVGVGRYHHFTNNLHAYVEREDWRPKEWLAADRTEYHEPLSQYATVPLVSDQKRFDRELVRFVDVWSGAETTAAHHCFPTSVGWEEPFLDEVARPMLAAYRAHRMKDSRSALRYCSLVTDDGWRAAADGWLTRRMDRVRK